MPTKPSTPILKPNDEVELEGTTYVVYTHQRTETNARLVASARSGRYYRRINGHWYVLTVKPAPTPDYFTA